MGTDETKIPEGVQIDKAVVKKGEVKSVLTDPDAWNSPAPRLLKIAMFTLIFFCAGMQTIVGLTDIFVGGETKKITLILSGTQIFCGALLKAIGVVDKKK